MPLSSAGEISSAEPEVVELTMRRAKILFIWNLIIAAIHLACGIAIFVITDQDIVVPVYTTYANSTARDTGYNSDWRPIAEYQGDVIVGYLSGAFLLLCFLDHFLVATILRRSYEYYLRHAQNPYRWIEYFASASIMRIEIALLSGVLNLHLLIAIFGLTATTMLFGLLQERFTWTKQGVPSEKSLLPFWLGCIPHLFAWAIVYSFFFRAVDQADPPNFVWAIIWILFLLDGTFAIAQYLQQKEIGRFRDYIVGEQTFQVLSLTSKLLLAWINYGGSQSVGGD